MLAIRTALGDDVVGLRRLVVTEELGRPFQLEAELSSLDPEINFSRIVGHPVSISLELSNGKARFWHGIVSHFSFSGQAERFFHYRAVIVPALWELTKSSDCRIFQAMTAPEMVQDILRRSGLTDFELRLSDEYAKSEYCVQYRETHFDFISRLMEHEGIAYHFRHTEERCLLVLGDDRGAYDSASDFASLSYHAVTGESPEVDTVYFWEMVHQVLPTEFALKDFNFEVPRNPLFGLAQVSREYGTNAGKIFDYPGEHSDFGLGERLAQTRLDELQSNAFVAIANTGCLALSAGALFTLTDHPRIDQNREYLVTWLKLTYDAGEFSSDQFGLTKSDCSFRAIPSDTRFRPTRITRKPFVQGPQTAMVVGPTNEEIYTDSFGRVKLYFHWDRHSAADESSSCWVRVSQGATGKGWGMISLPRVGQEVIVEFLEGNPDRPIVTGRVYNGINKVPYSLPKNKTISTLKSNSTQDGAGFNEIRLEDKKGEEQIFIHGEKNHDVGIKNNVYEWVGNDRHLVIKKNQTEHVGNNRSETIDADHVEKIGKARHLKVAGKEAKKVDGSLSLTVKGDAIEVFKANHSEQTAADYYLKADNIVIEAMTNITIKVGESSIAIEAGGIAIKTSGEIKVESTGSTEVKATGPLKLRSSATAEMKSPATTLKGDMMTTIKGGMVMIN